MPPIAAGRAPSHRVAFIDLLRGWAVIVMIETHVVNATLRPDLRGSPAFDALTFLNGLVAPSFIFASGMAFAITAHRKHAEWSVPGPAVLRQAGRLLFILSLGYAMHLPRFSLGYLLHGAGPEEWRDFVQVDVLQLIAVTLLGLQVGLLLLREERRLFSWAAAGAAVVVLGTPLAWGRDLEGFLWLPVASYLNAVHGSLFPLFPWAAFLLAGAVVGHLYTSARESDPQGGRPRDLVFMRHLTWFALAMGGGSFLLHPLAAALYPQYDYWRSSPSFVLLRLALVLLLCSGLFWFERRRGVRVRSAVALMGRESLLVYVVHLMLIYGDFGPFNLSREVARGFGYAEAAALSVALVAAMWALARLWSGLRGWPPHRRHLLHGTMAAVALGVLLLAPGP